MAATFLLRCNAVLVKICCRFVADSFHGRFLRIVVCVCFVCAAFVVLFFVEYPGMYSDEWTLGAATYPSQKSAMSVRRHTKVLADGEGKIG